ncbi:hypothetical protein [Falsiroseomonas sp. CW058]|uniref:hypothetical protein n=1 Tax=Falsiroseomonas sp. CW058 TaxID=3388664 RepID=UPI003D31D62E
MSRNVHILINKASDGSSLSGGSWRASAPLSNIQTQDVSRVARSTDASAASTMFVADGGSSPRRSWSMFVLINHSISVSGRWRVVCTNDAADTPESRIYDSGLVDVWEASVGFGTQPWGVFPWNGIDQASYPTYPIALHLAPASVRARYVFIYIEDPDNPDGYIDIGRFVAGDAMSPATNISYGFNVRYVDPSEVVRTLGGRRIVRALPSYRVAEMEFGFLSKDEAMGQIFEWQKAGKGSDVFFVKDPDETAEKRARTMIYGALTDIQPIREVMLDLYSFGAAIEELI